MAATDTSSVLISYGPILVGMGGLLAGIVAAFGRKDKKQTDQQTLLDTRTNTALKGLDTALERTEAERARWELRATGAERRVDQLEEVEARLEAEVADLKRQLIAATPVKDNT